MDVVFLGIDLGKNFSHVVGLEVLSRFRLEFAFAYLQHGKVS